MDEVAAETEARPCVVDDADSQQQVLDFSPPRQVRPEPKPEGRLSVSPTLRMLSLPALTHDAPHDTRASLNSGLRRSDSR
jgi:hypothetical protein